MNLAPGVSFDEDKHEYWYKGKQLSGVTGLIARKLGLKYSTSFVDEHREEGLHIHKAVQRWIETGDADSVHPGVQWVTGIFRNKYPEGNLYSEVLITDFHQYASSVDIILDTGDGIVLFDIKKGVFKRDYVTLQLSVYKYFIDGLFFLASNGTIKGVDILPNVIGCVCICLKDKEFYPIFPKSEKDISNMLYGYHITGSITL
jgi:hypothetical protein